MYEVTNIKSLKVTFLILYSESYNILLTITYITYITLNLKKNNNEGKKNIAINFLSSTEKIFVHLIIDNLNYSFNFNCKLQKISLNIKNNFEITFRLQFKLFLNFNHYFICYHHYYDNLLFTYFNFGNDSKLNFNIVIFQQFRYFVWHFGYRVQYSK